MRTKRNFSAKREAIYSAIASTKCHPSAEWVYDVLKPQIPGLSLGTVYRNIAVFKDTGIIRSVGVYNGQERFDAVLTPHSHFICTSCFKISDIPGGRSFADKAMYDYVEQECNASVSGHSIVFYGLCSKCRQSDNSGISTEKR